jgi:multiple antibiotic resistance protein
MVDWTLAGSFIAGAVVSILIISNPVSTSAIFIALTERMTLKEKVVLAKRSVTYSVIILVFFALTGLALFRVFGFSIGAFRIAGGVLLMTTAAGMMNPKGREKEVEERSQDIAIIPLSIPFTAGPGTIITVVVLMSEALNLRETQDWGTTGLAIAGVLIGIAVTVIVSYQMMVRSEYIDSRLGSGRRVLTRLMGLIVMAIAIQFILNGIRDVLPDFVEAAEQASSLMHLM